MACYIKKKYILQNSFVSPYFFSFVFSFSEFSLDKIFWMAHLLSLSLFLSLSLTHAHKQLLEENGISLRACLIHLQIGLLVSLRSQRYHLSFSKKCGAVNFSEQLCRVRMTDTIYWMDKCVEQCFLISDWRNKSGFSRRFQGSVNFCDF